MLMLFLTYILYTYTFMYILKNPLKYMTFCEADKLTILPNFFKKEKLSIKKNINIPNYKFKRTFSTKFFEGFFVFLILTITINSFLSLSINFLDIIVLFCSLINLDINKILFNTKISKKSRNLFKEHYFKTKGFKCFIENYVYEKTGKVFKDLDVLEEISMLDENLIKEFFEENEYLFSKIDKKYISELNDFIESSDLEDLKFLYKDLDINDLSIYEFYQFLKILEITYFKKIYKSNKINFK